MFQCIIIYLKNEEGNLIICVDYKCLMSNKDEDDHFPSGIN